MDGDIGGAIFVANMISSTGLHRIGWREWWSGNMPRWLDGVLDGRTEGL